MDQCHAINTGHPVLFSQPYAVNGTISPQSNVDFDLSLRSR